ncbi:hypothetical protein PHLCEN_2v7392 [Hermanssonia centrifuga]|uniref:Uncharacterized protein n=1 Tax=Hermanssonia centrifuga TaxID=98765 RepID=A0A2R6NWR6_9APHY|nr:hypothetical protein PHLCEN_2v7392 [Hermanssonia centrifuga]
MSLYRLPIRIAQGREIAAFLVHVIRSGGVLQVLQDANVNWRMRSILEGYLRTLVIFGEMKASMLIVIASLMLSLGRNLSGSGK